MLSCKKCYKIFDYIDQGAYDQGQNNKGFLMEDYFTFSEIFNEERKKELLDLYRQEWWCKDRTARDVEDILKGSSFSFGLIDQTQNRLAGFIRVLTDFYKYAYVYDVIIAKDYRGQGLSRRLMDHVINHPQISPLKNISLTCVPEMTDFYKKYEFTDNFGEFVNMVRRNPKATRN